MEVIKKVRTSPLENISLVHESPMRVEQTLLLAKTSRAANHPIYKRFEDLGDRNNTLLLKSYLSQYGHYSKTFVPALIQLINKAPKGVNIDAIEENLREEQGNIAETGHKALPHRDMYALFVNEFDHHFDFPSIEEAPIKEVTEWAAFTNQLQGKSFSFGVGALGIATELILSDIFQSILIGLRGVSLFPTNALYFLELHAESDEKHGSDFAILAGKVSKTVKDADNLENGTRQMLDLRVSFCDAILSGMEDNKNYE